MCVMGSTIFAKSISETAEIFYNNIKIYIDGVEIVPKDANGNTTEPFTMKAQHICPFAPFQALSVKKLSGTERPPEHIHRQKRPNEAR